MLLQIENILNQLSSLNLFTDDVLSVNRKKIFIPNILIEKI